MTHSLSRRDRLMATLRGEPVDRPAVSFYEIGGLQMDPTDADPFNIYHDLSWQPLLELAEQETDLIRLRSAVRAQSHEAWDRAAVADARSVRDEFLTTKTWEEDGSRVTRLTLRVAGRELTSMMRREPDTDTLWTVEHLVKDRDDLLAYLQLPDAFFDEPVTIAPLRAEEEALGDRGIVMVDTEDPLCAAATLMSMQDYTIVAFTENCLFHQLLEKLARPLQLRTEQVAREFPGHLWRIYGPEYASEPYLPPHLFGEYVVRYVAPMVRVIRQHGGFARIHCHGRVRNLLDMIVGMGADAIDPLEPPPHGDVTLEDVRRRYGEQLVLFGNLEVVDIERMEPAQFDSLVCQTLQQGTTGPGRGFVLMPSASPIGRTLAPRTLANYQTIVRRATTWCG
ncbi:MAG: uroporphyrinogen decarboxylase family protein [Pirellulaceae bacterium]